MLIQAFVIEHQIKQQQDEALNIVDDKEREAKLNELDERLDAAERAKLYGIPFVGPFVLAAHILHELGKR